ncbi:hypothetical protein [Luteipulveratus flavus]|uniref:PKD domain-containing protein n=1 Tax=Luteipulveratus flavus TaxID=3031728 RepID=A0ABT6C1T1_9MICO|nr:hypothetical protein [Luteipulveratus sp. YIM 133296]MDF8262846.1 hypothetical protein [Luteipulveratus sp. YIM 133296]
MSTDLEQLLRDAFEARAAQVTPQDLEHRREQDVRRLLSGRPERPRQWRTLAIAGGGLAAAALVVGTLVVTGGVDRRATVAAEPSLSLRPSTATTAATSAPSTTSASEPASITRSLPPAGTGTRTRTRYVPPTRSSEASRHATSVPPSSQATSATSEPTTSSSTTQVPARLSIVPSVSVESPQVAVSFTYRGYVHPSTAGGVDPTYTRITFGDGQQVGSDGGAATCDSAASTEPMSGAFPHGTNMYAGPGTYTITFTVGYCGDNGPTTATATRTVTIS